MPRPVRLSRNSRLERSEDTSPGGGQQQGHMEPVGQHEQVGAQPPEETPKPVASVQKLPKVPAAKTP